jgi:hypothetical protein
VSIVGRTASAGCELALPRLSGRDSALVGSLVAALLAEQKTVEPDDELLRFVRRGRRLRASG